MLGLLLLVRLAFAGSLSGTWTLDVAASEPVDALLEASGASWVERQLAGRMKVTQVIDDQDHAIRLEVRSTFRNLDETLVLDDTVREQPTDRGGTARVRHRREPDGAVVTVTVTTLDDGRTATLTLHRDVDGDTMTQLLTLELTGAAPLVARRVFRRQP